MLRSGSPSKRPRIRFRRWGHAVSELTIPAPREASKKPSSQLPPWVVNFLDFTEMSMPEIDFWSSAFVKTAVEGDDGPKE